MFRKYFPAISLLLISFPLLSCFYKLTQIPYLTFSDGAKFADIGRNLASGLGYGANFVRFGSDLEMNSKGLFSAPFIPPLAPFLNAVFFKLFGVSDLSVIAISSLFYLLLVFTVFLLGKKLWGGTVGLLAAVAVVANINLLNYATSGASETLFAFEIVLAAYLFALNKRWPNILGFLILALMYFTKAQAIIYILGILLFFLLLNLSRRKALGYFLGIFILSSVFFIFISKQGIFAVTQSLPGVSSSDALRGGFQEVQVLPILKKVFYNLYNFYKLLPEILSPYMWALFIIGLFKWNVNKNNVLKDNVENSLKIATTFMVAATFFVTALTIPLYRYLHPVIPLVYLFAISTLVWIVEQLLKTKKKVAIVSFLLVFIFVVGQTLGVIFLDSRFKAKTVNKGRPPVYVELSWILRDNTNTDEVVVTNLDTWGSWYGERRTIWYPLKPEQLMGLEDKVDAIYLTSYLINDENYYMGPEWRQIFQDPRNIKDKYIAENYKFAKEFSLSSEETYEKQDARAVLLVRK